MITIEQARELVAKGAAHLDVVRPGWWNRIDVGTLTLHDPCGCIVGQLSGNQDFFRGCDSLEIDNPLALGFDTGKDAMPFDLAFQFGNPARRPYYQSLQDAWIEAIADRRLRESTTSEQRRRDHSEHPAANSR